MNWTKTLMGWYGENKRDFPWRNSRNPYHVWLSEIILQQTRVQQGLPYYLKFIEAFPTVLDLASAPEEKVLKLWQGLGYYSRARNLLFSAQWIVEHNVAKFPDTHKDLLKLKGVGDYTASAIASICFEEPQAVVDGNVYRFLSRYFGIELPIDSSQAHAFFKAKATELMLGVSPGDFNQALMEFGALQCTPKLTNCSSCPFSTSCIAFQQGKVDQFPVKSKKTKVRKRYFNYLVLHSPKGKTLLQKRTGKGIWQNLYEFPLVESEKLVDQEELIQLQDFAQWTSICYERPKLLNPSPVKHLLSHQQLYIQFWGVRSLQEPKKAVALKELKTLPVPVVIGHFMDKHYSD